MIKFDGVQIDNAKVILNKISRHGAPKRNLQTERLAFQDGFATVRDYWTNRTIKVEGIILEDDKQSLVDQLDTIKKLLSGVDKNIDIDHGDGTRRYKGTLNSFEPPSEEHFNIDFLKWTAEFDCQPFGYGTEEVVESYEGINNFFLTDTINVEGTYKPLSEIKMTFNGNASKIVFSSPLIPGGGNEIVIEHAFSSSDVLLISEVDQQITLNGAPIDFKGPMPFFNIGKSTFDLNIPSGITNFDFEIKYFPRFL